MKQTEYLQNGKELATLGGGCFWCLDAVFTELAGVDQVISGYSGGTTLDPTYHQICTGNTGHAEVIRVIFNPQVISFKNLLEIFFTIHDPTTLNRQGADRGTQYRSVIFYHTPEQKITAEQVIKEITTEQIWNAPIVTEISPLTTFYQAEDYHQDYYKNNSDQMYCLAVVAPKVTEFRKNYFSKLKK
ncbi:MAG: peptide-methionine (S)-S-oxide reductase MsrA [Nitrospiria bacterium]